eukprot:171729-Prorocentrum_minimum.AAC.1
MDVWRVQGFRRDDRTWVVKLVWKGAWGKGLLHLWVAACRLVIGVQGSYPTRLDVSSPPPI